MIAGISDSRPFLIETGGSTDWTCVVPVVSTVREVFTNWDPASHTVAAIGADKDTQANK